MKIERFISWLTSQGAEILPVTNEFEVVRFRARRGVGVVYKGRRGYSFNGPNASEAWEAWRSGEKWAGKGKPAKRRQGSKRKRQLLDRDGDRCFYCGEPLGDDITVEHLVALNQGGPDRLENTVLAHQRHNQEAGNLPVIEKVKLRERMRRERIEEAI